MNLSKQQLAEQIATTENYLDQLRTMAAAIEPEAVKGWPQDGDTFYAADMAGSIGKFSFSPAGQCHRDLKVIGNMFRTEALVCRHVEALKVQAELRRMPGRCGAPSAGKPVNSFCIVKYPDELFSAQSWGLQNAAIAGVWFATKEAAQHALDTIGQERLAVYLADFLDEPMGDE